ncbi:MAG: hypothetical protein AAF629_37415, partial [Chloroflexota bacterium]
MNDEQDFLREDDNLKSNKTTEKRRTGSSETVNKAIDTELVRFDYLVTVAPNKFNNLLVQFSESSTCDFIVKST